MVDVILPELGEGITKATVSFWYFRPGDAVKSGQDLVELATDKATFNLSSPSTGKLSKINADEGATVKIGEILGVIE